MVLRHYYPPFLSLSLERVTLVERPFAVEVILAVVEV
jgi:hypothetical protein